MQLIVTTSASIEANPMLYVRPSTWFFKCLVCVHRGRVCPGSVGTRQALLQGWLCVSALCALQMCLTWCGGYQGLSTCGVLRCEEECLKDLFQL